MSAQLTWGSNADSVAERYLIAAHIHQNLRDLADELRIDFSLIGASHNAAYIASHLDPVLEGHRHDLLEPLQTLLDGRIDILPRELFTGCSKDGDLFDMR